MQTIATPKPPQVEIDALALNLSKKEADLAEVVGEYNAEVLAVHNRYRRRIVEAAGTVAGADAALRAKIDAHRDLFTNPKSWTQHGQQFGLRKGAGKLTWDDPDEVVARIEKHFDEAEAELLIKTEKKPIVAALQDLDAKVLAKLGCCVEGTGDVVFVRPIVSDAHKLLKTLLKEGARLEPKPAKAKKGKK